MKNTHSSSKRLESLDALRGFDLFFLVALGPLMHSLARTANVEWLNESMWVFSHVSWEGFSPWDLIMPLFLFMSGISMPFSLSRYKSISDKRPLLRRLAKRILLLWIFGMMCQGNLLALDPNTIYLYSNTLQAIATGYLITALLFLFTSRRTQIITAVVLLLVYWTAMQFITVDGYGGGNYTPQGNLAEWIDNTVLGRFRDTAQVIDGKVVIADWYHYTWILSSLNFGVTVLTGLFAGYIAKDKIEDKKKLKLYFGTGITMVIAGWLWNFQMPVIKTIWTSSMVLVSSGYCFLLMGLFYYWIDYKGHRSGITWLKVYGMNSIVAYMLANVVNFRCIGESLFYGLEQYMGSYYSFLMTLWNIGAVYVIIWFMYKRGIFLKV
ncbi:acyltransferase family protein [Alistipes putredinis]|uniref:acyltransferase family protein n=1 Tax=Alistipes putredinis TaxID=28117 RepID=UPI003AB4EC75